MAGTGLGIRSVPCAYVWQVLVSLLNHARCVWQVLASAFAQYYIFAYIIFIGLCIITSPMLLVELFGLSNNMPVHYIYTHAHLASASVAVARGRLEGRDNV